MTSENQNIDSAAEVNTDGTADVWSALALITIVVVTAVFWVSNQ
ncbi:MAG: hypothetical protein V3T17_08170 [Pseudomonadales bacterium]